MTDYIIKRLLLLLPTLLGALVLIYFIMNILPGDVAQMVLGQDIGQVKPELLEAVRKELGLDQPAYVRFGKWLWNALQMDFGNSLYSGVAVTREVWVRLPISFSLTVMALIVSAFLSIPLGIFMALHLNSFGDYFLRVLLIGGISIPSFWAGILVIIVLLTFFHWIPPIEYSSIFVNPWVSMQQLVFPALVLGLRPVATQARILRSQMLEVLGEDYVRTARAKGMPEKTVIWRHVLKNALPPVVTMIGMEAATLIATAVIVETVFGVPGVGSLLVKSIGYRDINVLVGIMTLVITLVVIINLAVDILYSFLDPRVRYGKGA